MKIHVCSQVVLMSATLDSGLFARYFGGCPILAAGGRTFPVEHLFLEDAYELTGCGGPPVAKSKAKPFSRSDLGAQDQGLPTASS